MAPLGAAAIAREPLSPSAALGKGDQTHFIGVFAPGSASCSQTADARSGVGVADKRYTTLCGRLNSYCGKQHVLGAVRGS